MSRSAFLVATALAGSSACSAASQAPVTHQSHSNAVAVSPDGAVLFVVHPDADSVSAIDLATRTIKSEIRLAAAPAAGSITCTAGSCTGRFDPAVMPRALALDSSGATLYVTGERSGRVYAVDTAQGTVRSSDVVCSEPAGVVVSVDDASVYVACSQDDEVLEVDAASLAVESTVVTPRKPWGLGWAADGKTLLATHLLGPGVSGIGTSPFALTATWSVPDRGPETDPTEPHGQVRGIYDVVARPGSNELWVAHLMLGTDTPEPTLVFNNTVFPALSILDGTSGSQLARLSVQANNAGPGDNGAFGDVVSGPRAVTFSGDGKYAFVTDTDSEDLLVVDATQRIEATVVRPLPGHMPEGVVWYGGEVYVQERNTEDVVAFKIDETATGVVVTQDGAPFKTLATDPMPSPLRLGQQLFFSANSDELPITQNHWVACATCHVEGRSDAVTWLFAQGPRDTPSNAGGMLSTGFLFRTADRSKVEDYWQTIDLEQGGDFHPGVAQNPFLDAIAEYVNYALPVPVPPSTDEMHQTLGAALAAVRSQGETVFNRVGCSTCHNGPFKTDSGSGNPSLDLSGPIVSALTPGGVLLHDVGTCVTDGPWPDVAHDDIDGDPRPSCAFDTPALRGMTDSAPFLHDGSAATLEDVLPVMLRASTPAGGAAPTLGPSDQTALIEYLRSL
jgi:DNA-binding beta-propeller fold protein YncE